MELDKVKATKGVDTKSLIDKMMVDALTNKKASAPISKKAASANHFVPPNIKTE